MKKILHIINGEFFAGAERVQDLLALQLPKWGYECGFVCLKDGVFEKSRKSTNPLLVVPMRSRFDISIVRRIALIAREGGYAAIHSHTPRSALIGRFVALATGLPLIHHVHSPAARDTESPVRNFLGAALERFFIFATSRRLIPVSHSLKGYLLERGVRNERISVVPNGVPVVRQFPVWQMPSGKWKIGTVALFRPRKGLEVLLQALRRLIDAGLDVELHAVGAFETVGYEMQIKQLATELQLDAHITWVGFTRDVHAEMEKMHTFVLPSLYGEGLPMVVIEAMSVGVPVVASDVEGIPEVLMSEAIGVIAEPGNSEALATALFGLIQQKQRIPDMVNAAHTRQKEVFSDAAMAAGVAAVYDAVLAGR